MPTDTIIISSTKEIDSLQQVVDSLYAVCLQPDSHQKIAEIIENGVSVKTDWWQVSASIILSLVAVGISLWIAYKQNQLQRKQLKLDRAKEFRNLYRSIQDVKRFMDLLPVEIYKITIRINASSTRIELDNLQRDFNRLVEDVKENEIIAKLNFNQIDIERYGRIYTTLHEAKLFIDEFCFKFRILLGEFYGIAPAIEKLKIVLGNIGADPKKISISKQMNENLAILNDELKEYLKKQESEIDFMNNFPEGLKKVLAPFSEYLKQGVDRIIRPNNCDSLLETIKSYCEVKD